MKHELMKRIRNAKTTEELKTIMKEVLTYHAEGTMSDETFDAIYDVFTSKRNEF